MLWSFEKTLTLDVPYDIDSADTQLNGKYIFGAIYYHPIYVWDKATGQRLDDLNWYAKTIALSPDRTRLAAVGTKLVTIWNVADLPQNGE
jgi:hypothetical protein